MNEPHHALDSVLEVPTQPTALVEPRKRPFDHPPPAEHEAFQAARHRGTTPEGQRLYGLRSGIEGTVSQGVRSMGLRQAWYRGLKKVRLQHVATATA